MCVCVCVCALIDVLLCFLYSVTSSADLLIAEIWHKGMFKPHILFKVFNNNYYTRLPVLNCSDRSVTIKTNPVFYNSAPFVQYKDPAEKVLIIWSSSLRKGRSLKHVVYRQLMAERGCILFKLLMILRLRGAVELLINSYSPDFRDCLLPIMLHFGFQT